MLVIGLPALDVLWTIIRRVLSGKNPFKSSDRKHLHHRLIDMGLSQKQAVLFFYSVSAFFGLSGLFLQSQGKFLALFLLLLLMLAIIIFFYLIDRKKLLLHICCAPCGAYLISEILLKKYEVTLYFYNSNINTLEEYEKRLFWVKELAREYKLKLEIEPYNHKVWLKGVGGLEAEPEGGGRCQVCYFDRLQKTAEKAQKLGIKNFYTTLIISPYKDSDKIKDIGGKLVKSHDLKFLELEFDKVNLSKKSIKLSKEKGYYRQKYCGCEFPLSLSR